MTYVILEDQPAPIVFHGVEHRFLQGDQVSKPDLVRHLRQLGVPLQDKAAYLAAKITLEARPPVMDLAAEQALRQLDASPAARPAPKPKVEKPETTEEK